MTLAHVQACKRNILPGVLSQTEEWFLGWSLPHVDKLSVQNAINHCPDPVATSVHVPSQG